MSANANKPKSLTLRAETDPANCYGTQNAARMAEALSAGRAVMLPAGASPADYAGMPRRNVECAPDLELTPPPDAKAERQRINREAAEQIAFMDKIRACLDPDTGRALPGRAGADMIYALANENAAGRGIGALRWKMGVKKGLPDLGIFVPHHGFCSAFIEMKQSGGVPSDVRDSQRECLESFNRHGFKAVVCFGAFEAYKFTAWYLGWESSNA